MRANPYDSFKEWEKDMDRIRAHPNDSQLMQHVRGRVNASSEMLQKQVYDYLQDMAFASNPINSGEILAKRTGKILFIRNQQDPWFYV